MAIFLWLLRDLGLLALLGSRRPMTAKRASQIAPRRAKRHPRGPQDGSGGPRDGPRGPQQRSRDLVHSSRSNPLPLLFSCSVPRGYGKAPHPDARHLGQTPRPAGRGSALVSYNAVISACEKGQQWWRASALLSKMWEAKLEPNVIQTTTVVRPRTRIALAQVDQNRPGRFGRAPRRPRDASMRLNKVPRRPQDGPREALDGYECSKTAQESPNIVSRRPKGPSPRRGPSRSRLLVLFVRLCIRFSGF